MRGINPPEGLIPRTEERHSYLLDEPQLTTGLSKGIDGAVKLLGGVSGGNLGTDTSLLLGHNGVEEAHGVDTQLQQAGAHALRKRGIKHNACGAFSGMSFGTLGKKSFVNLVACSKYCYLDIILKHFIDNMRHKIKSLLIGKSTYHNCQRSIGFLF